MKPEEAKKKRCKNWAMMNKFTFQSVNNGNFRCIADDCMGWPKCKLLWELDNQGQLKEAIYDFIQALIDIRNKT